MTPSASFDLSKPNERHSVLWASVVALLFAAVAAISFALTVRPGAYAQYKLAQCCSCSRAIAELSR